MLSRGNLFSCLLLLYAVAAAINHIDDTDETHGYWEPLHYFLYGKGLQTWEYGPMYAIRTYAFIYPLYLIAYPLTLCGLSKLAVFYSLRMLLGLFSAFSASSFIFSIRRYVNDHIAFYTFLFVLFSPGYFYISTSYLPSALCSSFFMLCISEYLQQHFAAGILYGCFAVIVTGWPFCALLFLPFGVHMMFLAWKHKGIYGLTSLLASGLVLLVAVSSICAVIDTHKYGKWTFPPWNIIRYNALGSSGDELYGTEPTSYYVINLLLTMNVAWPLALVSIIVYLIDVLRGVASVHIGVCLFSLMTWLAILFSRPHKEERFMYPAYCLIALAAGYAVTRLLLFVNYLPHVFMRRKEKVPVSNSFFCRLLRVLLIAVLALFGAGRVLALKNNYQGYLELWKSAGKVISANPSSSISVCMGGDWYTFPSHFFLPNAASLNYVSDNFHGLLPQHYSTTNGTSCEPTQPFNDRNEEQTERYLEIKSCDYVVNLSPRSETTIQDMTPLQRALLFDNSPFQVLATSNIIDPQNSPTWSRVVYIPYVSNRNNMYLRYVLAGKQSHTV